MNNIKMAIIKAIQPSITTALHQNDNCCAHTTL